MDTSLAGAPAATAADVSYRAYQIRRGAGIDGLYLRTRPQCALRGHEVRVRMRAVALNHRDLMVANGLSGAPDCAIVPASDGAGEVIEVGPEVAGLRVGDRVTGSFFPDWLAGPAEPRTTARALGGTTDGMLAEEVVGAESAWVPMPSTLSFIEAATLPCAGLTAWHALFGLDPLRPAATVALLGSGGVSTWALKLAKAAGHRVLVTSSDDAKLDRLQALGANGGINYRRTPAWGETLRELSGGRGVDRVLDLGGPDTIAQSIAALCMGGTVAVIGRLTGATPAAFDPATLFTGSKRLVGLMVGSRAMAVELARTVESADLHPVIDRVFGFDEAPAAYAHLATGSHLGKIVVSLDRH